MDTGGDAPRLPHGSTPDPDPTTVATMPHTVRRLLSAFAAAILAPIAPAALAEELRISGSGKPEYVLRQLADEFNRQQRAHRVTVPTSIGIGGALREVASGRTALGRVGRALTPDERARGLVYLPFGRDPLAFVAGAGVAVKAISSEQVIQVYSGRLADWRDLGGRPGPIRAIGREATDESRQVIQRHIGSFASIEFGESVKVVHLDPQMIELLDRYPRSLGFLNRSALAACQTRVRLLALDGVEPSVDSAGAGRYPLWIELGFVYRSSGPGPAGRAFIDFVRSPAGERILRRHGVLPVAGGA